MNNSTSVIVGVGFLILGSILFFVGMQYRKKSLTAQNWPITQGKIISATLEERRSVDHETHRVSISYVPTLQYEYRVGETSLVGQRIDFANSGYDHATAARKLASYPVDSLVTVYYNPTAPEDSLLNPSSKSYLVLIIIGALLLIAAILLPVLVLFSQK
jgi:Protein of unknown function (DUF3592)